MADVFISHHVDSTEKLVRQISDNLQKRGISCWYCERDEKGGVRYLAEIAKAIKSCRVFLVIMNKNAIASDFVNQEVHLAQEYKHTGTPITILPFRVEDCQPNEAMELIFAGIHYINGIPPTEKNITVLVDRIAEIIEIQAYLKDQERKLNDENKSNGNNAKIQNISPITQSERNANKKTGVSSWSVKIFNLILVISLFIFIWSLFAKNSQRNIIANGANQIQNEESESHEINPADVPDDTKNNGQNGDEQVDNIQIQ